MNESDDANLRELSWKRRLTDDERRRLEAWLNGSIEARAQWVEEEALSQLIDRLPDAPVSSNFTARVLQAIEQEQSGRLRSREAGRGWSRWLAAVWLPRAAAAALVVAAALMVWREEQRSTRHQIARSLAGVTPAVASPGLEVFIDFDAIERLAQAPAESDVELLSALE